MSRIVLGTVQLGLAYGIANRMGKPDGKMAGAIVSEAWENGIREFDTAQGYGDSETVLGEAFSKLGITNEARVISKLDPQINHLDGKVVAESVDKSLKKLRCPSLYGLLLHNESSLEHWKKGLGDHMRQAVQMGKVKKIGVSVYSVERAIEAVKLSGIDVIQLPANIWDQRFEKAGFFKEAEKRDIEVYVRSVFLQGLLLLRPDDVPGHLSEAKKYLEQVDDVAERLDLTPRELALGYIFSRLPKVKVVLGVESVDQLRENLQAESKAYPATAHEEIRNLFANMPEEMINPTLWKKS